MPQTKAHILSTKHLPQQYIDYAANEGIKISCRSFISMEPISAAAFSHSLATIKDISTVVFTSEQGVRIVAAYLPKDVSGLKAYCISGASLSAAKLLMSGLQIAGIADNGKTLAEQMVKDGVTEAVFFCSDIRMPTLPDILGANNIRVEEVIVYHTIAQPQKLDMEYDGIIFYSPSGVQSFFSMNDVRPEVPLFAIGNTTAANLPEHPNPVVIAERPDIGILIDTIVNHYKALEAEQ